MDLTACPPPVVAALDDGPAARSVAMAAADHAHRELRPLLLVTAVASAPDAGHASDGPWHRALAHLAALRQDLAGLVPAVPVRTFVCAGEPGAALRDRSAGAAVLVVGRSTGAGGLGPVTRELLGAATCPVLVVPHGGARGTDVVAGVDVGAEGVAGRTAVLAAAALQSGTRGSALRVVGVRHGEAGSPPEVEQRILEACAARLEDGWPGVPVTVGAPDGDPARELVALSADAGLLVLGGPATPADAALVETVTAGARCPVLVVPPPPDRDHVNASRRPAAVASVP